MEIFCTGQSTIHRWARQSMASWTFLDCCNPSLSTHSPPPPAIYCKTFETGAKLHNFSGNGNLNTGNKDSIFWEPIVTLVINQVAEVVITVIVAQFISDPSHYLAINRVVLVKFRSKMWAKSYENIWIWYFKFEVKSAVKIYFTGYRDRNLGLRSFGLVKKVAKQDGVVTWGILPYHVHCSILPMPFFIAPYLKYPKPAAEQCGQARPVSFLDFKHLGS